MPNMPKDALPDRYVVDVVGTPDPEDSQYYVLNLLYDHAARVSLRRLVRDYRTQGQHVRADELEQALDDSHAAFVEILEKRNPRAPARKRAATKKEKQNIRS